MYSAIEIGPVADIFVFKTFESDKSLSESVLAADKFLSGAFRFGRLTDL